MQVVYTVADLRQRLSVCRNGKVGFVPTMGNLHEGHLALVAKAQELADVVVVSIFVNPLQFGPGEDLDAYPRTLLTDQQHLAEQGVDLLFAPTVAQMYPQGQEQLHTVHVPESLEGKLCGRSRPGHFTGVATVVTKLFNMVQPDLAVFGEKDFQQLAVIRRMVADLDMPITIVGLPTVREEDGLAKSSRNGYLTQAERRTAPILHRALQQAAQKIQAGEKNFAQIQQSAVKHIAAAGFELDYLFILNAHTLEPAESADKDVLLAVAAWLGKPRLIDNVCLYGLT